MRTTMKRGDEAYRAIAEWRDSFTGEVVHGVIAGPYSKPGTAKGAMTQELNYHMYKDYNKGVATGQYTFERWVEKSATTWNRID